MNRKILTRPRRNGFRRTPVRAGVAALCLAILAASGASAAPPPEEKPTKEPLLGRLFEPAGARIVVREEKCSCDPIGGNPDVLLLTVGSEKETGEGTEFHPMATFAFDRSVGQPEPGQWLALWLYGPSSPGAGRTLAAWSPVPAGTPGGSKGSLRNMSEELEELRAEDYEVRPPHPAPYLDLTQVGRFPTTTGFTGLLKRILGWINLQNSNPGQFVYRSYLTQRGDRNDRNFQRAMVSLYWLLDSEVVRYENRAWLDAIKDLKFHIIRTRSFWGRFLSAADAWDLVLGYEGSVREYHGKNSAWMHVAANEHYLRYEPIYRFSENERSSPMAGILYYDPRIPDGHDPGWWDEFNPFDLTYNPHKNPRVQALAREHPDELIPLAIYTYQTKLGLRPIITIDFFDPGNPRVRERNQYMMTYLGHWLGIATGALSLERLPYRAVTWAANKKGLTLLASQPSRLGVEELRMAIEGGLYFREDSLQEILAHADERTLNPLVRPAAEERLIAMLQYESLRVEKFYPLCREVGRIRRTLMERFGISPKTQRVERRKEFAGHLIARKHMNRLRTLRHRVTNDYGSLEQLAEPLAFFETTTGPLPRRLPKVLAKTYQDLRETELALPEHHGLTNLPILIERTRTVWRRISDLRGTDDFDIQLARRDTRAANRVEKRRRKASKQQAKELRSLLEDSRKVLTQAATGQCDPTRFSPADSELYLVLLREVVQSASGSEVLQRELARQKFDLRETVAQVEAQFAQCEVGGDEEWRAESRETGQLLARALLEALDSNGTATQAGGGH